MNEASQPSAFPLRLFLLNACLRLTGLLTALAAASIFLIHAQPYYDRAAAALLYERCSTPCFIEIQPGATGMEEAVFRLGTHDWVANGRDDFPQPIRDAIFYGALVPRTLVDWQWSAPLPDWIDENQPGHLTIEYQTVRDLTIETRLMFGEVVLTFGSPDQWEYDSAGIRRFQYAAWYAEERMLVSAAGYCASFNPYNLPVRIFFRQNPPRLDSSVTKASICG